MIIRILISVYETDHRLPYPKLVLNYQPVSLLQQLKTLLKALGSRLTFRRHDLKCCP